MTSDRAFGTIAAMRGAKAGGILGVVAALALLGSVVPRSASATSVVELGAPPAKVPEAGHSLRVPGHPPAARFLRGPGAGASSLHILDAAAADTRTNGRILGIDPVEGPFSCSGTALSTPSRSMVITAGHCVIESGSIAKRIAFVPAYDHGARPFGTFAVNSVYVMPQWRHGENPDFDVAALRVAPNELGALTDVVGARGYTTAKSRTSAFQIFGYPAAALEGQELRSCHAHGLGSDPFTFGFEGPPTMPSSCDMAAGASGGAWVVGGAYVNGVTSYGYTTRPGRLYSPYFGPEVGAFLQQLP
jgi:V8-like Glu-specific endopeptidase